jgi:branched-chain amino acid transport system ATP-binding protein
MSEVALQVEGVVRDFGGLRAVDSVDMAVRRGSIHGLVGPNGAGKTTLFNVVAGLYPATRGRVVVNGTDVTRLAPEARVAAGLCRTFQTPQLFEDMTVFETVMAGCHRAGHIGILGSMMRFGAKRRDEDRLRALATTQIEAVGLQAQKHVLARNLSYGQRRLLEVAALIRRIVGGNATVVLIEHDMRFVMGLSERVTVLNFGRKLAEGTPAEIVNNEEVVMAYLGRKGRRNA